MRLAVLLVSCLACGKVNPSGPDAQAMVELRVTITGTGTVTDGAALSCSSDCMVSVPRGATITLTASANLVTWGGACSGTGSCQIVATADAAVSAEFSNQLALTVVPSGTGTGTITSTPAGITCPGTCSATFDVGTMVTLAEAPTNYSGFDGWAGGCTGTTSTCMVTLAQTTTVTPTFSAGALLIDTAPAPTNTTDIRSNGAISTALSTSVATTLTFIEADLDIQTAPTNVKFAIFDQATSTLVFYSDAVAVPVGRQIVKSPPMSFAMTVGTRYHIAAMVEGTAAFPWDQAAATANSITTFAKNGNPTNYAAPTGPAECCSVDTRLLLYGHQP